MTNIDRARRILESMTNRWGKPATARHAARALADAGLLTPEPQIIRTREELAGLDPDTLVQPLRNEQGEWPRAISAESLQWSMRRLNCTLLPAVVIATGEQVRAAQRALKEEE